MSGHHALRITRPARDGVRVDQRGQRQPLREGLGWYRPRRCVRLCDSKPCGYYVTSLIHRAVDTLTSPVDDTGQRRLRFAGA